MAVVVYRHGCIVCRRKCNEPETPLEPNLRPALFQRFFLFLLPHPQKNPPSMNSAALCTPKALGLPWLIAAYLGAVMISIGYGVIRLRFFIPHEK